MKNIIKRFPGVLANDNVSIDFDAGEIHAIVGENGAGKSTLMKILYGEHQPDSGRILMNGKELVLRSPRDAIKAGIGMVHQKFMLVPSMKVYENIILGDEIAKRGILNKKQSIETVKKISKRYGLQVDVNKPISEISVGSQQRVEILKLLYRKANVLIFDEPTSVLTPSEVESLFKVFENLKKDGKTVIFITHKLDEVMKTADRISVMKNGKLQGTVSKEDASIPFLTKLMVGGEIPKTTPRKNIEDKKPIVEFESVSYISADGVRKLNNVSFQIHSGEIFGIAGVEGNGQKELIEVTTGISRKFEGTIRFNGNLLNRLDIFQRRKLGMAYISEDPFNIGTCLDANLIENLISTRYRDIPFSKGFFMNWKLCEEFAESQVKIYGVKAASVKQRASTLSGGNLQKVVIARELSSDPIFVLAAHPTKGLDIKATSFVHDTLTQLRNSGKAILLISANLDELLTLSDRIGVLYRGKLTGVVVPPFDRERIGLMMLGKDVAK